MRAVRRTLVAHQPAQLAPAHAHRAQHAELPRPLKVTPSASVLTMPRMR